jgi:uncharacterized protein YuzE
MKLSYFPETDSLYIELADRPGADAEEIRPGIVVDLDEAGVIVGIDIERASQVLDLSRVVTSNLPYGANEA